MTGTTSVQVGDLPSGDGASPLFGHIDTYVDEGGLVELYFAEGQISGNSRVFASVTEIEDEEPVVGSTVLTVQNVTPMTDSLMIRLAVDPNWGRHVRLYFLIAN